MALLDRIYDSFFKDILKGESQTYNDHNWYASGGLKGFIEGRSSKAYPLLTKPLQEYTVSEVMAFQRRSRDSNGQLWATGRYQIIPDTLEGLVSKTGISRNAKYNKETQDILGKQLLVNRKAIWDYLTSKVPDNQENLEKAALQTAMIWSSLGIPKSMSVTRNGKTRWIEKDQSYYTGGGDKASVKSEVVMEKLRGLRNGLLGKVAKSFSERPLLTISIAMLGTLATYTLATQLIKIK